MGVLGFAVVAVVAGCGGESDDGAGRGAAEVTVADVPVAVTRGAPSVPGGCRPGQVARVVVEFFGRYNRGDPSAASLFAFSSGSGGGLVGGSQRQVTGANWYSVTEGDPSRGGRHVVARDPAALADHVRDRHEHGERLRLLEVRVRYEPDGLGHVEYRLTRRADDLEAVGVRTSHMGGKGAIDCDERRIVAWSMGVPSGPVPDDYVHATPLCPRPPTRSAAPVACAA
jgi:hypothetical protein